MAMLHLFRGRFWFGLLAAAALLSPALVAGVPAQAAPKPELAAEIVPGNAAFFCEMLRNHEVWEGIAGSRAWAKLRGLPVVQMGLGFYAMQAMDPDSVPGKIEEARSNPEVRKALQLALEMLSDNVFVYGGPSTLNAIEFAQQMANTMRFGGLLGQLNGQARGMEKDEFQKKMLVAALCRNASLIKAPEFVVGFRVKNLALAKEELKQLETIIREALEEQPKLKETTQEEQRSTAANTSPCRWTAA